MRVNGIICLGGELGGVQIGDFVGYAIQAFCLRCFPCALDCILGNIDAVNKLTEIAPAQRPFNDSEAATNRHRLNRLCKAGQKSGRMIDPIDCRISGGAEVHIL